jgi:type IV secretion system protein VirB10
LSETGLARHLLEFEGVSGVAEQTSQSPSGLELRGAPLASARLSRKAAMIAIGALALVAVLIMINLTREPPKKAEEAVAKQALEPALNAPRALTESIPDAAPTTSADEPPVLPAARTRRGGGGEGRATRDPEEEARLADTAIGKFAMPEVEAATDAAPGSAEDGASEDRADDADLNRQAQKLAFLGERRASAALGSPVRAPASRFEIKTGTVIPSMLLTELNSDLPGEIVAQVTQNVYDTATGNELLIPQGTKLFGRYDSKVAFGQGRLLVSWHRLIFPDASTLELGGMAGHDEAGKSGFHDRVNNHYGRIFGAGLLTSLISAGYALTQDRSNSVLTQPTDQQVVAAAVGQQMAMLGVEIARRNLQVQPTIEIRKGYRLNVMVNKDVVFPGRYPL